MAKTGVPRVERAGSWREILPRVAQRVKGDGMLTLLADINARGKQVHRCLRQDAIILDYLGPEMDRAVDHNVHKQSSYMPGARLPIHDLARVMEILSSNFKDEIVAEQATFEGGGGRFIVPISELRILILHTA